MDVIKNLIERARQNRQRIVLPEGTEERTLKAADKAIADGIADLIILGNKDEIIALAQKHGLQNIEKATIIDPCNNPDAEKYATLLYELRKAKGMTPEDAQKLVCNPLYLGCLIIKNGDADG
ncbi:MAG: phosphate acetyltransferase, partial [Bacteroidaceae bacterium]|nr:phosphate acetyltransferase [Bacteroidaceae bacterium]